MPSTSRKAITDSEKLQKIIAAYTNLDYTRIDLTKNIEETYIDDAFSDNFANDICNAWRKASCTDLHNEMFVSLKTGNDILKFLDPTS